MLLRQEQAQEIIACIQENELARAFALLRECGVSSKQLNDLEREYTFGRFHFDFYDRLQVFVNGLAQTDLEVKQPQYDLFFSYSSADHKAAELLVEQLRVQGLAVFFSDENLKNQAGRHFFAAINSALQNSTHFLLYATPSAMASEWVKLEYETFFTQYHLPARAQRRFFIVPGTGFDKSALPPMLAGIQWSPDAATVLTALGKKDNLAERQVEYAELYETFLENEAIGPRERDQLLRAQQRLHLNDEQICSIEARFSKPNKSKASISAQQNQPVQKPSIADIFRKKEVRAGAGGLLLALLLLLWRPWSQGGATPIDNSLEIQNKTDSLHRADSLERLRLQAEQEQQERERLERLHQDSLEKVRVKERLARLLQDSLNQIARDSAMRASQDKERMAQFKKNREAIRKNLNTALIHIKSNDIQDAVKLLKTTLNLPDMPPLCKASVQAALLALTANDISESKKHIQKALDLL